MPEYIEREAAVEAVRCFPDMAINEELEGLVRDVPAADVAPVLHAHWEQKFNDKGRSDGWICTAPGCGVRSCCKGNYCLNCGAKMDEEVET